MSRTFWIAAALFAASLLFPCVSSLALDSPLIFACYGRDVKISFLMVCEWAIWTAFSILLGRAINEVREDE